MLIAERITNFSRITEIIQKRARHLLARETRLGSTMRLINKARIADDELRERIQRLKQEISRLRQDCTEFLKNKFDFVELHEFWPLVVKLEALLNYKMLAFQKPRETQALLEQAWETLDEIVSYLEEALGKVGTQTDPVFSRLTPEELEAYFDTSSDEPDVVDGVATIGPEHAKAIASLLRLHDSTMRCTSETRAILAGRFDPPNGRGAPRQNRGKRLAAELLGIAEGIGLKASRDHESHYESGIDAVLAALRDCEDITDPAARTILAEIPTTFDAFARQLPRDRCKDRILIGDRRLGRVLGPRLLHQT